jgi:hypothetical protein
MRKLILSLAAVALLFTACSEDDDDTIVVTTPTEEELSGDVSNDLTLDATIEYTLNGTLRILDGGVLTIPAGTVIKAELGFSKFIIVEQGGQIFVNGTSDAPVVMTSSADSPEAGDWGGLIINGYASISGETTGTTATTEIDPTTVYGGTDDSDNSGTITYLELAYTGAKSSSNVEHNGLTLNAVGNGTTINNIYVPYTADDGVEFFGGTVNVTNMLVVSSDDDMFDITQGWSGTLTNAYGVWESDYTSAEGDPRGIESDGNYDGLGSSHVGQSNYTIADVSIVNNSSFEMHDAIKVRRGATATITNALIQNGTVKDVMDFTDSKGDANSATSVSYKTDNVTISSNTVNQSDPASTATENTANTGADVTVLSWTGYSF